MRQSRRSFVVNGMASAAILPIGQSSWAQSGISVGAANLISLSDGNLRLPAELVVADAPDVEVTAILDRYNISGEVFEPECNVTLLQTGDRTVLFDTGAGANFMPTAGKLFEALDAAGIDPFDVTDVVFTHAHPDHIWGLLDEFDDFSFPDAAYHIGRAEWDYWTDPDTVDAIGEDRAAFAVGARSRLDLISDRVNLVEAGAEVLPGIQAVGTFGHTPGHLSFAVSDGNASAMILGDCIANHHIAFEQPTWHSGSDQDQTLGAETRASFLDQLATDQITIVGFHLPNGGIGKVERRGSGYHFVQGV